jgi:hypothetical protein
VPERRRKCNLEDEEREARKKHSNIESLSLVIELNANRSRCKQEGKKFEVLGRESFGREHVDKVGSPLHLSVPGCRYTKCTTMLKTLLSVCDVVVI